MPCKAASGRVAKSPPALDAKMSVVALSTSFAKACRDPYEPSCIRLEIVGGPVGEVSLARFESDSPEEDRVMEAVMGWDRIDGCVS